MTRTDVLIAGAGPTGLVMALWLARLGVDLRIVDIAEEPGKTSRAAVVQARILEFYRQLGIDRAIVAAGLRANDLTVRRSGRYVAKARLDDMGEGQSPHPFILSLPQDEHERVLVSELAKLGVEVQRSTRVTAVDQDESGARVTLEGPGGTETVAAQYVCGCDGAHSTIRRAMGLAFPGGTYSQVFYVADAEASGEAAGGGVQACISDKDFCLVFPVRRTGTMRLIGTVPPEAEAKEQITFDDVTETIVRNSGLTLGAVHWFATYHVHHRIAGRFRDRRLFLSGDAAHIHSPAGGQGMNTGIGDAIDLAWRLGAVVRGNAAPALLDSYEPERMAFARTLVATTDTLFRMVTRRDLLGRLMRSLVMPNLFPLATRFGPVRRFVFRVISQIRIHYRASPLSSGEAGRIRGGDRLPWLGRPGGDNFLPLQSLDWQLHVYGKAADDVRHVVERHGIELREFAWGEDCASLGFLRDAAYLVRPDGHVAIAAAASGTTGLSRFLSDFKIRPLTS